MSTSNILGEYSDTARSLAALTGLPRKEWAEARTKYFTSGLNKESLHVLESAMFHVSNLVGAIT